MEGEGNQRALLLTVDLVEPSDFLKIMGVDHYNKNKNKTDKEIKGFYLLF